MQRSTFAEIGRKCWLLGAALVCALVHAQTPPAASATLAVASNFAGPMQKIAQAFTQDTGHQIQLSFGATGKFYAQIQHGAPFDVLLSADDTTPTKLAQEGLADAASQFTYATGRLVLWSPRAGYVDNQGQVLQQATFGHLAIANPKVAPYGKAAAQTLEKLGLRQSLASKLVQGENISQTYQFVASGNAALGFVALSQVMESGSIRSGSAWLVPAALHSPIRQNAIVLQRGQHNRTAQAVMEYLKSDKARDIMRAYGYAFE